MKKNKLFIVLPLIVAAIFLSDYALTTVANLSIVNRAWDVVGPGVTSRKDCSSCHTGVTPVTNNTTSRIFTFGNSETSYKPNQTYTLKFKIFSSNPVGFSSTVLRNDSNIFVGTLTATDTAQTKLCLHTASGRYYLNHRVGTTTSGSKEYTFSWTAPATGKGAVTFYFGSLSSNNDQSTSDDTTYQNSYVITEAPTGISEVSNQISLKLFPNPATDKINISFLNNFAGNTEIALYSIDGKQSIMLLNEKLNKGEQNLEFDLSGKLKPGIYFIRVSNENVNSIQKILFY